MLEKKTDTTKTTRTLSRGSSQETHCPKIHGHESCEQNHRSLLSRIQGVKLIATPNYSDSRGDLITGDMGKEVPFKPKRYFVVCNVPEEETRGNHAHLNCHQLLICLNGSVCCSVDDGYQSAQVTLDRRNLGLYIPPMIWNRQFHYSKGSVLLVFASHLYDRDDYLRSYSEFSQIVRGKSTPVEYRS